MKLKKLIVLTLLSLSLTACSNESTYTISETSLEDYISPENIDKSESKITKSKFREKIYKSSTKKTPKVSTNKVSIVNKSFEELESLENTESLNQEETTEPLSNQEIIKETAEPISQELSYTVEKISELIKYSTTSLNIRKGPSTEYEIIGYLKINDEVTVTGIADTEWYEIKYADNFAFVSNKYVSDTKVELPTYDIANAFVQKEGIVDDIYVYKAEQEWLKLPEKIRNFFINNGAIIYVSDTDLAKRFFEGQYTKVKGVTLYGSKTIYLEDRNDAVTALLHETGHLIESLTMSDTYEYSSFTSEFGNIFTEESDNYMKIAKADSYSQRNPQEFFAEAWEMYILYPNELNMYCPKTFNFITNLLQTHNLL